MKSRIYHGLTRGWQGVFALVAVTAMLVAGCGDSSGNPGTDLGAGPLLAFIGQDGNLWMARADGTGSHAITTQTCPSTANCYGPPAWSADGQHVAIFAPSHSSQGNVINIFNRLGLIENTLIPADPASFGPLLWSPDNKTIGYQGRAKLPSASDTTPQPTSLIVLNVVSRAQEAAVTLPAPKNADAACSDEPFGGPLGSLIDHAIDGSHGFRYSFDWSHDGSRFLVSSGQCALAVSVVNKADSSATTLATTTPDTTISQGAFAHDGQYIIATQQGKSSDALVVFDATGANGKVIYTDDLTPPTFTPRISSPVWSTTDQMIYFMHGADLWVVNVDSTNAHQLVAGATTGDPLKSEAQPLASPDGKSLAWMELTFSTTDNLPRTNLMVGNVDATQPHSVAPGAVWPSWS